MIPEHLKELVKQEADNLKVHATKYEISNLDFDTLNGMSEFRCVYGQMTGNCNSDRAIELLNKCAVAYSEWVSYFLPALQPSFTIDSIDRPFSAIEFYIYKRDSIFNPKNQNLINYLKGETETLEL